MQAVSFFQLVWIVLSATFLTFLLIICRLDMMGMPNSQRIYVWNGVDCGTVGQCIVVGEMRSLANTFIPLQEIS